MSMADEGCQLFHPQINENLNNFFRLTVSSILKKINRFLLCRCVNLSITQLVLQQKTFFLIALSTSVFLRDL